MGSFPGGRWAEWNDRFRDDVRAFWRGDPGLVPRLATRLAGSSDLYLRDGRKPFHSINFITSHDGFTLNDLVSYARKHNEANGQENRDGRGEELSANPGAEGDTDEPAVRAARDTLARSFLATLLLSVGTPMILGGDELRRSQRGNNNAWCQDNEISWIDWGLLESQAGLQRFTRLLIGLRRRHPLFQRAEFLTAADVAWLDAEGRPLSDWANAGHRLACLLRAGALPGAGAPPRPAAAPVFLLLFNAAPREQPFTLPPAPGGRWHRAVDTGLPSPLDAAEPGREPPVEPAGRYLLGARALALLQAR